MNQTMNKTTIETHMVMHHHHVMRVLAASALA